MKHKEHSVDAVIKHNGWDGSGKTFPDIAIIKLANKVKFKLNKPGDWDHGKSILPACLPDLEIHSHLYDTKAYLVGNRYVHYLKCMISAYVYRECVRNLDLRVQVHPGELWVSKQRVHIVLDASKSAGAKGDVPKICGFVHPLHPL